MKFLTLSATLVSSLAILISLGGCSNSSEVKTAIVVEPGGFVSPGKGGAPVSMSHHLGGKVAVGETTALELVFKNDQELPMLLEISADEALVVERQSARQVNSGQSVVLNLQPRAEGRYYVNVIARMADGANSQAKVYSVPVQVGSGGIVSTAGKATVSPDGERLIRMRAQEKPTD